MARYTFNVKLFHLLLHAGLSRRFPQIRGLIEAGLSTEDIRCLLPCATGTAPDLQPCTELLTILRERLDGLHERIDALTHSRDALHSYLNATEQAQAGNT